MTEATLTWKSFAIFTFTALNVVPCSIFDAFFADAFFADAFFADAFPAQHNYANSLSYCSDYYIISYNVFKN